MHGLSLNLPIYSDESLDGKKDTIGLTNISPCNNSATNYSSKDNASHSSLGESTVSNKTIAAEDGSENTTTNDGRLSSVKEEKINTVSAETYEETKHISKISSTMTSITETTSTTTEFVERKTVVSSAAPPINAGQASRPSRIPQVQVEVHVQVQMLIQGTF